MVTPGMNCEPVIQNNRDLKNQITKLNYAKEEYC